MANFNTISTKGHITAVAAQKRNPSRCSIFVDNAYAFSCAMDTVLELGLGRGLQLDRSLLNAIRQREEGFRLRQVALRYALYKPRTEFQVRGKLRERGFEESDIDAAVEFLAEFGYVDDRAFARAFIRDYLQRKPAGKRKLRQELIKRGIADFDCDDALAECFPGDDVQSLARRSALKKLRAIAHKEPGKRRDSLVQYLQRQGFDWETIRFILDEFSGQLTEE